MNSRPDIIYSGTSSNLSNVQITYTGWRRRLHRASADGWWGILDALGHELHLPRWLQHPICDRFEIAVGIPREDLIRMDYTSKGKRTPWWLLR